MQEPVATFQTLLLLWGLQINWFKKKKKPAQCLLSLLASPPYQQASPQQWGSEPMCAWKLAPVPLAANCTHRVRQYCDFHYLVGLLLVSSSIEKGYFELTGWFTIHFTQKCRYIFKEKKKLLSMLYFFTIFSTEGTNSVTTPACWSVPCSLQQTAVRF